MKIIFLDIDGVIATQKSLDESGLWGFTNECQENLQILLKNTGAKLVISSSWRKHTLEDTVTHLKEKGFWFCDDIIGMTIRGYHFLKPGVHLGIPRGVEIKQWLDTNIHSNQGKDWNRKEVGKDFTYVILDDDADMLLEQKDYFIQCNPNDGLTIGRAHRATLILNSLFPNK